MLRMRFLGPSRDDVKKAARRVVAQQFVANTYHPGSDIYIALGLDIGVAGKRRHVCVEVKGSGTEDNFLMGFFDDAAGKTVSLAKVENGKLHVSRGHKRQATDLVQLILANNG